MVITYQNWRSVVEEVLNNLQKLGVTTPVPAHNYRLTFNSRAKTRFGQIKQIRSDYYEIELNSIHNQVDTPQSVKETIIHEIIHSLPGCMNHGTRWKAVCDKYNQTYHTHLSRQSTPSKEYMNSIPKTQNKYALICDKCKHEWYYARNTKLVQSARSGKSLRCPTCGLQHFTVVHL